MSVATIDLSALNQNHTHEVNRILERAYDKDNGGGMINDLIHYGSEGVTSYLWWDYSEDKLFIRRTTTDTSPGRMIFAWALGSAMAAGENLQAMQIGARATGTGTIAGGTDGIETKAGWNSNDDTGTMAGSRALIANVNAKKGTITTATGVEVAMDINAGGEMTTAYGVRSFLNNSGTVTAGYAFHVDAVSGYPWTYGLYVKSAMATTGIYIGNVTTGIHIAGTSTTGISISGVASTAAISLTNQTSVCFVATTTLDSATEIIELTVTDASGIAAGRNRGVVVNYTVSAAQTGTSGIRVFAAEVTLSEDVVSFYGMDITLATNSGDPTIGYVAGQIIYIGNQGSGVVSQVAMDLNVVTTDAPSARNLFIRCRNHGTIQSGSAVIGLEGLNAAEFFIDIETYATQGCIWTGNKSGTPDGAIRVNANGSDRYILLYP